MSITWYYCLTPRISFKVVILINKCKRYKCACQIHLAAFLRTKTDFKYSSTKGCLHQRLVPQK